MSESSSGACGDLGTFGEYSLIGDRKAGHTMTSSESRSTSEATTTSHNGDDKSNSIPAAPKRHIACSLCRRRKLRCDGSKPTCSTCKRLGHTCEYSDTGRKAGPRRGYIKSLEMKVAEFERILSRLHSTGSLPKVSSPPSDEDDESEMTDDIIGGRAQELPPRSVVDRLTATYFATYNRLIPVVCSIGIERAPLVLRYAIMATAAAEAPQYRAVMPILYQRARRYIEIAPSDGSGSATTSQNAAFIQALCLIANIETRDGMLPQAWITIGKAYRAVTMMSLHLLGSDASSERRRAFWYLVFYDALGSLATDFPAAFIDMIKNNSILTEMPMDDRAFLEGRPEPLMSFGELVAMPTLFTQFPNARFAFCVVLATTALRTCELGQFPRRRYRSAEDWLAEFHHFDKTLNELTRLLPAIMPPTKSPEGTLITDKEAILLHLLSHCATLTLCRSGLHALQDMPELITLLDSASLLNRTMITMMEIIFLTRNPHDIPTIGAHPLHAIMLFVVGVLISYFLQYRLIPIESFQLPLEYIMKTLEELSPRMPLTKGLSEFLAGAVPPTVRQDVATLDVSEVLATQGIDLTLPNFFDPTTIRKFGFPIMSSQQAQKVQSEHRQLAHEDGQPGAPSESCSADQAPFLGINMRPFNPLEELDQLDSLSPLASLQLDSSGHRDTTRPYGFSQDGSCAELNISHHQMPPTTKGELIYNYRDAPVCDGTLPAGPPPGIDIIDDPPVVLLDELPPWNRPWH